MPELIVRKDGVDPYPEVLLRGEIFQSIAQSMNYHDFQPVVDEWLEVSGIGQIDPDKWYPRQKWLDLLKMLERKSGSMQNQVSIGMKVIDNAAFPPDLKIETVEQGIDMLIAVYMGNQQNLPEGDCGYVVRKVAEKHYEILDTSPYLEYVNYGYIYGILRRFLQTGFSLSHRPVNEQEPQMGGIIYTVELD